VRTQSLRQTLILAAVFTAVFGAFVHFTSEDATILTTLVQLPLFFAILFLTMRLTNRLTAALVGRFGPKPAQRTEPSGPRPPSTERPEHAQRRRGARRRRPRRGNRARRQ
jgi:hypothetical protein